MDKREISRINGIKNGPIYSHFTETINGLSIIRAFKKINYFKNNQFKFIDDTYQCIYTTIALSHWFQLRTQILANLLVGLSVIMCAITQPSAGYVGFILATLFDASMFFSDLMELKVICEQKMVSIERLLQYINHDNKEDINEININKMERLYFK
eukprot:172811_1